MKVSLREWIATGRFGAIELGVMRADVEHHLGLPPQWSMPAKTPQSATIWKYGDIEFYFQDDKLWMIFADDFEVPRGAANLELKTWIVERTCQPSEMERHLNDANVAYRVEDFPYADNGVRIIAQSGATLTFCGEDAARLELVSVFNSRLL